LAFKYLKGNKIKNIYTIKFNKLEYHLRYVNKLKLGKLKITIRLHLSSIKLFTRFWGIQSFIVVNARYITFLVLEAKIRPLLFTNLPQIFGLKALKILKLTLRFCKENWEQFRLIEELFDRLHSFVLKLEHLEQFSIDFH